jgi:predicted trehalose synthase
MFLRTHPDAAEQLEPWTVAWEQTMGEIYMRGYTATLDGSGLLPSDGGVMRRLLHALVMDKAIYELAYELGARPDWADIPLIGLSSLMEPSARIPSAPVVDVIRHA